MTSTLEKIARAAADADAKLSNGPSLYASNPAIYQAIARAALLALRDATDETTLNGSIICTRLDMVLSEQVEPAARGRKVPDQ